MIPPLTLVAFSNRMEAADFSLSNLTSKVKRKSSPESGTDEIVLSFFLKTDPDSLG